MDRQTISNEPYRLFFFLGFFYLIWGLTVWVPLIWDPGIYPVALHRFLMLNGFVGSFIGGFLMTAIPRFSQTDRAKIWEVALFFIVTVFGLVASYLEHEKCIFLASALQPLILLIFLLRRISKRKANPPFSFVFIFVGLLLWFLSGILSAFVDPELFKDLHYEGAIAAIIVGVGSKLIPGILGHTPILTPSAQIMPLYKIVPIHFALLIFFFVMSYFLPDQAGPVVRSIVVIAIAFAYWKLQRFPEVRSSLTWSIWISSWLIVLSFVLKAVWGAGMIHASHSFFINGIVLLSLLIAIRVIQSHGPQRPELENRKIIYVITFLVFLAAATRVSAFIMPESYLTHLSYSSLVLISAVIIWGITYLRFIFTVPAMTSK